MATATVFMMTGKLFPDPKTGHDQSQDDRNALITRLRGDQQYRDVVFLPAAWDDPRFDLDTITTPKLMLVGHSYGGYSSLQWANGITRHVDKMLLLDPVDPNGFLIWFPPFDVPATVTSADCYVRFGPFLGPICRHIRANRAGLANHDVWIAHQDFYRDDGIISKIEQAIQDLLAARSNGLAAA
jgi:pimeloyl-ACP methyl ester carboxylesterase